MPVTGTIRGEMTLLAELVAASQEVAATSARSGKVAILAGLLRNLEPAEVPIAVGLLSGVPRQGRIGVGYATVYGVGYEPAARGDAHGRRPGSRCRRHRGGEGTPARRAKRKEILVELLGRATEQEGEFVKRLLTGELRQGALSGLMLDAIVKAAGVSADLARRALMLSGDLTRTAELAMAEGEEGLRAVGFELFRPILPMLASTAENVTEAVGSFARASVEWKLDGIRIQIHRRGDEVRVYTRNLNDITHALPGIVDAVRALEVRQAVLDGEALWMGEHGPAAFQETVSQIDGAAPPEGVVTFLFDVLHLDGDDLLDTPLEQRAARLDAIARHLAIPRVLTSDPEEGERVLDEALRAGHEGVVVKDAASIYAAGRRGKAWRKVKPVRTYDLVVLGAEWGHGRRRGLALEPAPGCPRPGHGHVRDGGQVLQGPDGRAAALADERAARARDRATGNCGSRPARARRRDRPGRSPVLDALSRRRGAAVREGEALPARQGGRRSGHDRRVARAAPRLVTKPRRLARRGTR